jgi:Integrase core domain
MLIVLTTLLGALSSMFRSRAVLEVENLARRHQIGVLQRSARKRPQLTPVDRWVWVWLSRLWSDWRSAATARLFSARTSENRCETWGIREVLSTPRSPWQRAYVQRVIGSIRRECLDHVIVFHESSLRRILASYLDCYHRSRTCLSLGKESPEPRSIRYERRAAA